MDAAAADADVKLYKASGELIAEIQTKLPLLIRKPDGKLRKWILHSKTYEVAHFVSYLPSTPSQQN